MNDNNSTPKDSSNPLSVNPVSAVPPPAPENDLPPPISTESPAPPPPSSSLPPDGNDVPPPASPPSDNPPTEDVEQKAQEILGSENNSDRNHKGGKGKIYAIAAVVLLLLAIPAGIFLTQQMGIGDIRNKAQEASEDANIPAPMTERRINVAGKLVAKTDDSLTLEDKGVKTTFKFIPTYTKIYRFPSADEISPLQIPLNTYVSGSVLIRPKDRSSSGTEEVLIGEILRLPATTDK